jgi:tRNA(Arg) A34 adenosine deaminase TadA
MNDTDNYHLRSAIAIARRSRDHGNHPFGALLAGPDEQVLLEAENTVVTGPDCTGHAETNLMRLASRQFAAKFLEGCGLYTSAEPCPMCSGAIFWGGVGRVVFALGQRSLYDLIGSGGDELLLSCRDVFARGNRVIEVLGPALEAEALEVHRGFWK